MIFLTVGSWHRGYNRLIKAVDELVGCGVITDEVIAQTGNGSYKPKHLTTISFCSPDEFVNFISRSRLVISHAGVGTIAQAVKKFKPVVVVPRKASLGEHVDDHQFTTAKALESEHKILVAYNTDDIVSKLREAENFVPSNILGGSKIIQAVETFLEELAAKRYNG